MADRGEYRGIYVSLTDDPDFQDLSAEARATFYPLKLQLGKAGIDIFYPETLPRLTGFSRKETDAALAELRDAGWIAWEKNVYWIINGLRFEPSNPLVNKNGRKGIENHLESLPKLAIVNRFCAKYDLAPVTGAPSVDSKPPASPSEGASNPLRTTEDGERKTETDSSGDKSPGDAAVENSPETDGGTSGDSEPTPPPKSDLSTVVGALREHAYAPDGEPPGSYDIGRDLSIAKRLTEGGRSPERLTEAIAALREMADGCHEAVGNWIPPGEKFTLRVFQREDERGIPLLKLALHWHDTKHGQPERAKRLIEGAFQRAVP